MVTYEESNLAWQGQQWWRNAQEWLEFRLQGLGLEVDPVTRGIPDWLTHLALGTLLVLTGVGLAIFLGQIMPWLWQHRRVLRMDSPAVTANLSARRLSVGEWLADAEQQQQQGEYGQACRCLYQALLQQLHDQQAVSQQASRTDGEYQQILATHLREADLEPYQVLFHTHEQVCFGSDPISQSVWRQCQQAFQRIHSRQEPEA